MVGAISVTCYFILIWVIANIEPIHDKKNNRRVLAFSPFENTPNGNGNCIGPV